MVGDNAAPPDGWCVEPRACPCFTRTDSARYEPAEHIPDNIHLGTE